MREYREIKDRGQERKGYISKEDTDHLKEERSHWEKERYEEYGMGERKGLTIDPRLLFGSVTRWFKL